MYLIWQLFFRLARGRKSPYTFQSMMTNFKNLFGRGDNANTQDSESLPRNIEAVLRATPLAYICWQSYDKIFVSEALQFQLRVPSPLSFLTLKNNLASTFAEEELRPLLRLFETVHSEPIQFCVAEKECYRLERTSLSSETGAYNIIWFQKESLANQLSDEKIGYLDATLDNIRVPVCVHDKSGNMVWSNASYAYFFSKSAEDIIKEKTLPLLRLVDTKKKVNLAEEVQAVLGSQKVKVLECHTTSGGNRLRVDVVLTPTSDKDFVIVRYEDRTNEESVVSEGKRTVDAYHTLLENIASGVALFDREQALVFYNSSYAKIWGLEESWLNKKPKLGDVLEELRKNRRLPEQADFRRYKEEWLSLFTNLIEPKSDVLVQPDGTVLRRQIVPSASGGLMFIYEDITTNLELESSYNTMVQVQGETLNNLKDGVVVFGSDGMLKLWNPSYAKIWGFNPEDLDKQVHISKLLENGRKYYDEDTFHERKNLVMSVFDTREAVSGTTRRNDGVSLAYSVVPLPDGGCLFAYSDITDSVNVEKALREKNAALETAEKLKGEFLTNMSYQLRTPLNAIIGFNEILAQEFFGTLNEKQKEYTDDIQEAGQRLKELIDDILDLSSIEAGILDLDIQETDICMLINSITTIGSEWALSKQITLTSDCKPKEITAEVDPQRLRQVLMNLLRNAISFTPEKGEIALHACTEEINLKIVITDNGTGIEKGDIEKLFMPFETGTQKSSDVQDDRGAGLGLTLVKNIIELHDGTIDIKSQPKKGTSITLTLPLTAKKT